jgi:hypothetical protein
MEEAGAARTRSECSGGEGRSGPATAKAAWSEGKGGATNGEDAKTPKKRRFASERRGGGEKPDRAEA